MPEHFEVTPAPGRGRIALLRARGSLDAQSAPILLEKCAEVQARGENLVLNLSAVSFVGSSGIGALLIVVEQFHEQSGAVRLAALSPAVDSVVQLLSLGELLDIDATEDDAFAALAVLDQRRASAA